MYDIFGCASDFAHNFRHLMPTTLNCGATGSAANEVYMFQFHNGSIKRVSDDHGYDEEELFQFHNGSIKSDNEVVVLYENNRCFNSTMVRLKEGIRSL